MSTIRLSPTSYIVLGFISLTGEATPYDLKRLLAISVGRFWSVPHSQLYAEPDRLAKAGYLDARQEPDGRRRKLYAITPAGEQALADWREDAVAQPGEIRDPAALKLFFGADRTLLATSRLAQLEPELARLEELKAAGAGQAGEGPSLALDYGIQMTRAAIEFWRRAAH